MAYRALYRQYRPTRFEDVIGQTHITVTLKHQVSEGRVAHAYLLCGTRGTGKTTTARILARAVNCLAPEDGEPCGKCAACLAAADENNGDIIEIDAASNNGVDNMRDLTRDAQYAPLQLRRRVFIIDEVHMVTGAAFNALLKTLEEPPAHVMFILATTEPQKLPATILSRCQRFDFHRLSVTDIASTLRTVLKKAGASVEEDGLMLIARAADGGMRDALSLTDRCLSYCGDHVTARDVYDVLGSMSDAFLFDIADAMLASDAPRALSMLDDVVRGGRDLTVFCQDLSAHFRALLLARACGKCETLLDCTPETMARYLAQASPASEARLLLSMEQLLKAQNAMRYLAAPRTMLEATIVRICRPEEKLSLESLEARVDRLETATADKSAAVKSTAVTSTAVEATAVKSTAVKSTAIEATAVEATVQPVAPVQPVSADTPPWNADTQTQAATPVTPVQPVAPAETAATPEAPRETNREPTQGKPAAPVVPAVAPASEADALWQTVLQDVDNIFVRLVVEKGAAQRLDGDTLVVAFPGEDPTLLSNAQAPINYNTLLAVLKKHRPEGQLLFIKAQGAPVDDATVDAVRALFGKKLRVE